MADHGVSENREFGPGHKEWCPDAPMEDLGHCLHWYDCEPCHRCGDDTPDPNCDCDRCSAISEKSATPEGVRMNG